MTRLVAGTLATKAEVHVLTGTADQGESCRPDGALRVSRLPSREEDPLRTRLLLAAFSQGAPASLVSWGPRLEPTPEPPDIPPSVQRELRSLNGGPLPGALGRLRKLGPDAVVVAGYRQAATRVPMREICSEFRTVLLALAGTDPQLGLPVYDDVFSTVANVITITETESKRVSWRRPADGVALPVRQVGLAMSVGSRGGTIPDLRDVPYVLVIAGYPPGGGSRDASGIARYVATRHQRHSVVVVDERSLTIHQRPGDQSSGHQSSRHLARRRPVGRADLWRLMAGAVATVDLRRQALLGREALESMLLGTPVVVPDDSAAREHAELSDGGLWFAGPRELLECLAGLEDPELPRALGRNAASYAEPRYGRSSAFRELVEQAVLGDGSTDQDGSSHQDASCG